MATTNPFQDVFSNFLNGITQPIAGGIGDSISKALFGRSDRISNRDFQFYQDLADSGNPREIARQNQFLKGVTPTNAEAYNEYQDLTQPQDTERQINRIQSMGSELHMSPWELTGAGGANPLPSPSMGPQEGGGGQAQAFMSQLAPLQVAKMNNETALQQTRMNNETQLQQTAMTTGNAITTTGMQNDTAKWIAQYAQTGPKAQTEQMLTASKVILTDLQSTGQQLQNQNIPLQGQFLKGQTQSLKFQNRESTSRVMLNEQSIQNLKSEQVTKALATLTSVLPKEQWSSGGYTRTETAGYDALLDLARALGDSSGTDRFNNARTYIGSLDNVKLSDLAKAALLAANAVKDGAGAARDITGARLNHGKTMTPSEY